MEQKDRDLVIKQGELTRSEIRKESNTSSRGVITAMVLISLLSILVYLFFINVVISTMMC